MRGRKPEVRWRPRYSLRWFLIAVTLFGSWLGWRASVVRRIEGEVQRLEEAGCYVACGPAAADFPLEPRPLWQRFAFGYGEWDLPTSVHIGGLSANTKDLKSPDTNDALVVKLAPGINRLPSVTHIDLSLSHVTGACCQSLSLIRSLESVNFGVTGVGDHDLDEFALLDQIKYLEIGATGWTAEGVAALQSRLPDCELNSDFSVTDPFGGGHDPFGPTAGEQ